MEVGWQVGVPCGGFDDDVLKMEGVEGWTKVSKQCFFGQLRNGIFRVNIKAKDRTRGRDAQYSCAFVVLIASAYCFVNIRRA